MGLWLWFWRILWQYMSRDVRKPDFCICEKKDADQLRGNREADQRLCFRYLDSTIPLLPKTKISSLQPSSVAVTARSVSDLVRNPKDRFSDVAAHMGMAATLVMWPGLIYINFHSPFQWKLHANFGFNWPSGFREEDFLKVYTIHGRQGHPGHVT